MGNQKIKRIFQIALVSLGSAYFFACSSAQNLPSVSTVTAPSGCPAGIGGLDPSCCDMTGAVITPPTTTVCGVIIPGGGGVTNPIQSGATAGNSVGQNTGAAAAMVGGQKVGGLANEASGATAGQAPVATSLTGLGQPLGQSGLGVTTSGNASGGGQNGVGDSSNGNIATAPVPTSSGDPGINSGDSGVATQGDQYASGGGGGLLPNGAHATGFQFGNGLGGASGAAGQAEIGFGAQRDPAAMGDADPSDYFTRIGLEDSLFKKVEKRYRSTSAKWETASLNAPNTLQVKLPK